MQTDSPLASEFILFCQQRCQQKWPDLYDEMCWVAGRRLFHGMGYAELDKAGLSLGLHNIEKTIRMVDAVVDNGRKPPGL